MSWKHWFFIAFIAYAVSSFSKLTIIWVYLDFFFLSNKLSMNVWTMTVQGKICFSCLSPTVSELGPGLGNQGCLCLIQIAKSIWCLFVCMDSAPSTPPVIVEVMWFLLRYSCLASFFFLPFNERIEGMSWRGNWLIPLIPKEVENIFWAEYWFLYIVHV